MIKLFIGLLAIGSLSAFADCTYSIKDTDQGLLQKKMVRSEMKEKGFQEVSKEDAVYSLEFSADFYTQGGNGRTISETSRRRTQNNKLVAKGYGDWNSRDEYNQSVEGRHKMKLLRNALLSLPDCKDLESNF